MSRPWQVEMFEHGLKKRQKLDLLHRQLGRLDDQSCLLVTCGDNNGALNLRLRELGGRWRWMELEPAGIPAMRALLGEPVELARPDHLPADDGAFDWVVAVDVHEHLEDPHAFAAEIARVTAIGGGAVVTTPGGGPQRPVNRLKRLLGMDNATYGHQVDGIGILEHEQLLRASGLQPVDRGSYSRAMTETLELALNVVYVKLLGKGGDGDIAPRTADELGEVGMAFRVYRRLFPLLRAIAAIDHLLPFPGYAVSVVATKPPSPEGASGP